MSNQEDIQNLSNQLEKVLLNFDEVVNTPESVNVDLAPLLAKLNEVYSKVNAVHVSLEYFKTKFRKFERDIEHIRRILD